MDEARGADAWVGAGVAARPLIADPKAWINRRVETVELLGREEVRRRVSIDFTLTAEEQEELEIPDGVAVPISALTKQPRRNFDLRDEAGDATPVLGREQNGLLAHAAVLEAALNALPSEPSDDAFARLSAELAAIVYGTPAAAYEALAAFAASAEEDELRGAVWRDADCRSLLRLLVDNYVLFAIVPAGGPARRILKYGYSEDFPAPERRSVREALAGLAESALSPDRRLFAIEAPGAYRARSFHMEIVIPEELRFDIAALTDVNTGDDLGERAVDVGRAALYATGGVGAEQRVVASALVAPERAGLKLRAAVTSMAVAALLWLGYASDLDSENPGAAVSLLLAGAALYTGLVSDAREPRIVRRVFGATRRWLALVTVSALAGSASLAMEIPSATPTGIWLIAAIACTIGAIRLGWSAIRAA